MTKRYAVPSTWISPPGDTMSDLLEERGWSRVDFAKRLGVTPKHVNELLKGRAPIHAEQALLLSRVLGSTPEFWLQREANYRAGLARLESLSTLAKEGDWLKEQPQRWLIEQKALQPRTHKGEQVEQLLHYYGVSSVSAWRQTYDARSIAFRASPAFEKRFSSVSAWLRLAEIRAESISCAAWDEKKFRALLPGLRALTGEAQVDVLVARLQRDCAQCGVALVAIPTPPGCPISGATRWLSPAKGQIVLSFRHRTNDHFWFTFFHEAAHLLLHSKKLAFVEGLDGLDAALEAEADHFAREQLIPSAKVAMFRGIKSRQRVSEWASALGVAPGIIVGRLQHEGTLPRTHLNDLKITYALKPELDAEESEDAMGEA